MKLFTPMIVASWALLTCLLAGCSGEGPTRTSGILITVDTTRADALGAFGGAAGLTPHLDAFAEGCFVFENARTVTPITLPAHASMLTGLYPPRHGVRDNGRQPLPDTATTLAELAQDAGLETAAFIAAVVLDRSWGLAQGFDTWSQPRSGLGRDRGVIGSLDGFEVAGNAASWLHSRDRSRPFFLWVHFFDPHAPYDPPALYRERAGGDDYLGEVAAMDEAIGRLLAAIRDEGLMEEALIVVVGDHGEARGEHGEPQHTVLCYDSTLRVPLLVRPPGGRPAREASESVVSVVDVFPTFVEALGLTPTDSDGQSLVAPGDPDRGVYFESYAGYLNYGFSPLTGWVDRRGKYLHSSVPELYDVAADPGELENAIAARSGDVERYRERIRSVNALRPLAAEEVPVEEALLANIRGLGYAGTGEPLPELPDPLEPNDLPSPSSRTAELQAMRDAMALEREGRREEAIGALYAMTRANPLNVYGYDALARLLFLAGRFEEAASVGEELLVLRPHQVSLLRSIGLCYERMEDYRAAERYYRQAAATDPASPLPREDLSRALQAAGRDVEAAASRAEAERLRSAATDG